MPHSIYPNAYPSSVYLLESENDGEVHTMAPTIPSVVEPAPNQQLGPDPSYIQVAKPYLFQQQIQERLLATGANLAREDAFRLQGVQWINDVRLVLQL
jgi:CTD kinase subunit beta